MKIGICSDLHLEFGDVNIKNEDNVDVLILSGDILVERDLDMYDRRQEELLTDSTGMTDMERQHLG